MRSAKKKSMCAVLPGYLQANSAKTITYLWQKLSLCDSLMLINTGNMYDKRKILFFCVSCTAPADIDCSIVSALRRETKNFIQ